MNDVDTARNIIYLSGDITESTVPYFISRINYLVEHKREAFDELPDTATAILVYLNSYGGDMYSAFGIIDYMRVCDVKIGMACYGAATSAAALILINATGEKVMSKNSYLMFHPPWIEKDKDIDEKHMKDLKNKILDNLVLRSNKDKEFWNNKLKKNYYINARECLNLGLIHRVLSY
jgi:ATP-dependent Clp protease protease subunit